MSTFLRRTSVAVAAGLLAGVACTVHKSETPTLTGPSEFGLSVVISAIPDSINQDGASQSAIVVTVHDASGQPKAGTSLRADIFVGGVIQDFGQLSARTLVTGADGKASAIYTAPAAVAGAGISVVSILVTPIGTDFQAAAPRVVDIRLSPPGVIVPVIGAPLPRFVVAPVAPNAKSLATFDGTTSCGSTDASGACTTTSKVVTYAWDFGDGTTATGSVVTHAFPLQQTYSVALTVTNDKGVTATSRQNVVVAAGLLPTASFTFSPAAPGVGETVYFNAAASTPGAGHTIASYQWSSGDGSPGTGVAPSYKFLKQGTYRVTLVVVDEAGQSSAPVSVDVAIGLGTPAPTANFTSSPSLPVVSQAVVFDASSSVIAQGQTLSSMAWNFGDDTGIKTCPADAACNGTRIISHAFTAIGTYVVNLVVTDSAGRFASKSANVAVASPNPTAILSLFKTGGNGITADGSASTATGTATIATYRFIWGDGTADTVGTASSASHTFAAAGAHTVTLIVTDSSAAARTGSTQKDITTP